MTGDDASESVKLTTPEKSTSWSNTGTKWRILIILLAATCLVLTIVVLVFAVNRGARHDFIEIVPGCQSSFAFDPKWPDDPTVFQDLNEKELHAIRDFLLDNTKLNLTQYEKASLTDNFIYVIELYLSEKSKILNHIDNKGPKPERRARVIVFHGSGDAPYVEEYLVHPTLKPTTFKPLRRTGMTYPIPYFSRPDSGKEYDVVTELILKELLPIQNILKESFDGYSSKDCGNKCLVPMRVGFPASKDVGLRQDWFALARDVESIDLNIVPLSVLVEHADKRAEKWTINQVYYHNQLFPSVADLLSKYSAGTINKCNIKLTDEQLLRTTLRKRGKSFLDKPLRGPELVEPNGRRFAVAGRKISYMPWEFEFGFRATKGLTLFNVRFDNRRVLYELSVQEAASFYSSADPTASVSNYLDSFVGMAKDSLELVKGVDCPFTAVYLDNIIMVESSRPKTIKNCVCVFESYGQMPSRRHRGWPLYWKSYGPKVDMEYMSAMAEYALVIRTITVAENYDYIFDYILHLNGVIEVRTSTAGYLITTPYYNSDDDFAFQNFIQTKGMLHDHMITYKADLDIDGTRNSYQTLDITQRSETVPWNKTWTMLKKSIKRSPKKTELDSRLYYNFDTPKYYVFQNPNVKNPYGNPVGYKIQLEDMVKQVYPEDYYVTKANPWSKYQMVVTRQKDSEPFSGSIFNVYGAEDPVFKFDEYLKDNESIINEDLVSWITIGGLHIPNTEDIPTTFTTGNHFTFYIRPFGFFLEDPTMGSSDAVFITPSKDRKSCCQVETFGTPQGSTCPVPRRTFDYGRKG